MRSRAPAADWRRGVAISVVLHALVAGALLAIGLSRPAIDDRPATAMVVEIAPALAAPPAPPIEQPPGPEQQETPEQVMVPQRPAPVPDLRSAAQGEVLERKAETQPPQERSESAPVERVERTSAPAFAQAPPAPAPAAPSIDSPSSSRSAKEQSWEGLILAAFERRKRYPAAAQRTRQEDVVLVRIVIDRAGNVVDSTIRRSRGFAILDEEVLALVRRVSPLPRPPGRSRRRPRGVDHSRRIPRQAIAPSMRLLSCPSPRIEGRPVRDAA